jgi:hypothetical protein
MEGDLQLTLRQIMGVLEDVLGWSSRWNGQVSLVQSLTFAGVAHYNGSISINELIYVDADLRWRTLIHEALHTFSPQYTRYEYSNMRGWEEGVVEQMQRLVRPQVLAALGVVVNEEALLEAEANHIYNIYIAFLEDLRLRLGDAPFTFYKMLLACPLMERSIILRQSGILLDDLIRGDYQIALLKAVVALRR